MIKHFTSCIARAIYLCPLFRVKPLLLSKTRVNHD